MVKQYEGEIVRIKEWAPGLKSIYLRLNEGMEFKAGQYVLLKDEVDGKPVSRAYSIASPPNEEEIEILFRVVGLFTNHLNNRKVGDKLAVIGPFGHMTIDRISKNRVVFIATGTGVSPHISIVKELVKKCDKEVEMIYGTRYKSMLAHYEELKEMEEKCPKFKFHPVLSREENWDGYKGHVQDVLDEFIKENSDYYICGLPAMADDVIRMLTEKGVPKENIHVEKF